MRRILLRLSVVPILILLVSFLVITYAFVNPGEAENGYWVKKIVDGSYVIGVGNGGGGIIYSSTDPYVDDDVYYALNAMPASGGKVLFTPGDFVTLSLTVAHENLDISGSGRGTHIYTAPQLPFTITGYPTVQIATSLHDLTIHGGLKLDNVIRSWFYNIYFKGGSPALTVRGNSLWFQNLVFDYASPAAIVSGHAIHFVGGEMYGGGPIIWQGGQGGSIENFVIEGAYTYGLKIMGPTNTMLVQNNYFELNNQSRQPDIADIYVGPSPASGIALRDNFFTGTFTQWAIDSSAPYTIISGGRSYNAPVRIGGFGGMIEGQLAIFPKPTIVPDTISIAPTSLEGAGRIVGGWVKPPAWNRDPDTTGWGLYDAGRIWGRYDLGQLRWWDGTQIKVVQQ